MKKFKALLFAFVLTGMTLVSCSSNDDGPAGPAPTIEGKWNQIQTVVTINGTAVPTTYDSNEPGCTKDYLEFATASIFNDVVYFKQSGVCQQSIATPRIWTKTNNSLTISGDTDLSGTYEIVKLTNTELQIKISKNIGGTPSTAVIYMNKTL